MSVGLSGDPTRKVTIFAVAGSRVLVFDHPREGVQFPAGTVEPGESFLNAARRELIEETGLEAGAMTHLATTLTQRLDGVVYTSRPVVADDGTLIPAGYRVRLLDEAGGEYVREVVDYGVMPAAVLSSHVGRCGLGDLTRWVERAFFLAHVAERAAWEWEGDDGNRWICRFAEREDLKPFGEQMGWLRLLNETA